MDVVSERFWPTCIPNCHTVAGKCVNQLKHNQLVSDTSYSHAKMASFDGGWLPNINEAILSNFGNTNHKNVDISFGFSYLYFRMKPINDETRCFQPAMQKYAGLGLFLPGVLTSKSHLTQNKNIINWSWKEINVLRGIKNFVLVLWTDI